MCSRQVLSIIEAHRDQNKTSKQMLARTFAEYIIWDPVHGGFGQSRDSQERAKLMKLMIDHHASLADAVRVHTSLGARASRAGIAPDHVATGTSPEPRGWEAGRGDQPGLGGVQVRGCEAAKERRWTVSKGREVGLDAARLDGLRRIRKHGAPAATSTIKGAADWATGQGRVADGSLDGVMDEGLAVLRQLGDSRDALQVAAARAAHPVSTRPPLRRVMIAMPAMAEGCSTRYRTCDGGLGAARSAVSVPDGTASRRGDALHPVMGDLGKAQRVRVHVLTGRGAERSKACALVESRLMTAGAG